MFYLQTLEGFQAAFTQFENKYQELDEARRSGVASRAGRTWHIRRGVKLLCERFHLFPGVCFQMLCNVRATCENLLRNNVFFRYRVKVH